MMHPAFSLQVFFQSLPEKENLIEKINVSGKNTCDWYNHEHYIALT